MTVPPDTVASAPSGARQRTRPGFNRRYSRFVGLAKRIGPLLAIALLLLVAAWPRLQDVFERVRFLTPRLDLREAQDLRMVQARYTGVDRQHRPFVITAEVARQNPSANDVVALESPKGDMTTQSGSWFELSASSGVYQPQTQLLDLFGDVQLFQDKGNEFRTESAHIDMANGTAEGHQPIAGQGPFGHITGQGFRVLDHGNTIVFTGKSHLELVPRQGKEAK